MTTVKAVALSTDINTITQMPNLTLKIMAFNDDSFNSLNVTPPC